MATNKQEKICVLMAVGDTAPPREEHPERMFVSVKDRMADADIRFCQTERLFTKRGTYQRQGLSYFSRVDPKYAEAYKWANFDVVSTASNHVGEQGEEGVLDTVETINKLGISTIGSGRNIAEARKPAILTKNGVKVAFLGYCSVLLPQYWATEEQAGAAPIRVHTFYEPYEYQPGSPPRVVTVPWDEDVKRMEEDIASAKQISDCVVVSMHWGVHFIPKPLTDYQIVVARKAIEAGADVILGSHPHCLQGIEVLKTDNRNGVVFYSLGNFAFPRKAGTPSFCAPIGKYTFDEVYDREIEAGYTYRHQQFLGEGGIAKIQLSVKGLEKATFLPTLAMPIEVGEPKLLAPGDQKFNDIHNHLKWASSGLTGASEMIVKDGEIVIYERK